MQQHPGLKRVEEFERSRTCPQRVKDRKKWWTGFICFFFLLFLGLAALVSVIGRSTECINTSGSSSVAVVSFAVSIVLLVVFALFACLVESTEEDYEVKRYTSGWESNLASRGCWQRVKDHKRWWATRIFILFMLALVVAALGGVAGRSAECIRTDRAGAASIVLLVVAAVLLVVLTLFACCVESTEKEYEEAKFRAMSGPGTGPASGAGAATTHHSNSTRV